MKSLSVVRCVALLCVIASGTVAAVDVWPAAQRIRTQDRNGDGRPDIWRHYDNRGLLTEVALDSNFDGRPDIEEYYERGTLIRRESDRNFNGQADLVEDFDAQTHAQTRSVVDIDYDGTADLLVLFRDGRPVFSERTCSSTHSKSPTRSPLRVRHGGPGRFAPLLDPFESDPAVLATHGAPSADDCIGLSTSGGLPCQRATAVDRTSASEPLIVGGIHAYTLALLTRCSPRAPPVSSS